MQRSRSSVSQFRQLILARGFSDFGAFDQKDTLVISVSLDAGDSPFKQASWLRIDPVLQEASLWGPRRRSLAISLKASGAWAELDSKWTAAQGLPRILTPANAAIVGCADLEKKRLQMKQDRSILFAGASEATKSGWFFSPFAAVNTNGEYSLLAAAGGPLALSIPLPWVLHEGTRFSELRPRTFAQNDLQILMHAMSSAFRDLPMSPLCIQGKNIDEAIALVALRKLWGQTPMCVELPEEINPGWKRLIQHLGWHPIKTGKSHATSLAMSTIRPMIQKLDREILLEQINRRSRVIPESCFNN